MTSSSHLGRVEREKGRTTQQAQQRKAYRQLEEVAFKEQVDTRLKPQVLKFAELATDVNDCSITLPFTADEAS